MGSHARVADESSNAVTDTRAGVDGRGRAVVKENVKPDAIVRPGPHVSLADAVTVITYVVLSRRPPVEIVTAWFGVVQRKTGAGHGGLDEIAASTVVAFIGSENAMVLPAGRATPVARAPRVAAPALGAPG